jgi:hypothetical protein
MGFWTRRITNVAALMGGTAASTLLGGETDGLAIDFTDASLTVRDTTTTSNAWTQINGDLQTFWRDRSFTSYASPSPKITRDSSGNYTYRPHNLWGMSEKFTSAFWTTNDATITDNATTAPDGTSTAASMVPNTNSTGYHRIYRNANTVAGALVPYTVSFYAKANGYSLVHIREDAVSGAAAVFNLGTGAVAGTYDAGNITVAASIAAAGNDWYRVAATFTPSASNNLQAGIQVTNPAYTTGDPSGSAWSGNGTSGVYIWGAQFNAGPTALTYTKTQAHNLILQSQTFDNASWTKNDVTITANSVAAPDGTTTADTFTDSAVNAYHMAQVTTVTVSAGATVTASVYLKQGTLRYAAVAVTDATAKNYPVLFDLQTGTVVGNFTNYASYAAPTSSSITAVGNSWYRCSVTTTLDPAVTTAAVAIAANISGDVGSGWIYVGSSQSLYAWGAQLELASAPGKYVATTAAAVYESRYELPREWDSAGACQGLLVEEARTNLLTYSTQFDNAAWTKTNILSTTADATTSPSGQTDADLVIPTTGSSTHLVRQGPTTAGAVQSWSVFAKPSGYTKIGIREDFAAGNYAAFLLSGAGSVIDKTGGTTASIEALANGWYRLVWTGSSVAANQGLGVYIMASGYASGDPATYSYAGDGTSGVYLWQADQQPGAFITSPIYTGSASVTRAADNPSLNTKTFPDPATAGTLFVEFNNIALQSSNAWVGLNGLICASRTSDANVYFDYRNAGSTVRYLNAATFGTISANTSYSHAMAWAASSFNQAINGTAGPEQLSAAADATPSDLCLGDSNGGPGATVGRRYISRIMVLPRRMTNAQLEAVTT